MEPLNDWDDIAAYRDSHCQKCINYVRLSLEKTGVQRCRIIGGTNSTVAIEHGRCRYEEAQK